MTSSWLFGPAFVLAASLLMIGWRTGALHAAAWAALVVMGQAAALVLVNAGPLVGYQHFPGLSEAVRERPAALMVTFVVLAAAAAGAMRHRAAIGRAFHARPWRAAAFVALAAASLLAAAPSASAGVYGRELLFAALLQLALAVCVGLAGMTLPTAHVRRLDGWLTRSLQPATGSPRLDRYSWTLATFVAVVALVLCLTSYQAIPHVPDEIVYLIQARYLAAGDLWLPPPPVPAAFDTFLMEVSGDRWFGVFPPGWPLVLAAGVRLGIPFAVNPVLGGACILLTYLLVQELSDRGTARMTVFLLAVSPWHLFLSMSFMSHALSLALALVVALGTVRAVRTGGWLPALTAGLSLGILGMSRPLEGVALGMLAGIPLLVAAIRHRRGVALIGGTIGMAITGGLGLVYNRVITGSPWIFPAERLFDREYGPGRYGIGFGPEKGVGWTGLDPFPGHGPVDVIVNAVLNGFMVNIELFGWATGAVGIVVLGALSRKRPVERLMLIAAATIVALHAAYWFSGGPDFGARYWFLIIVPCTVLAVRGLVMLEHEGSAIPGARTAAAAGFLCVVALTLFVPWRAVDKYYQYRGIRADPMRMAGQPTYRNGLILITGERHQDWGAAANANDIALGKSPAPVFAWDRDPATRQALLLAYPDRPVWLVDGPSVTGNGYRVRRGPVSSAELTDSGSKP